VDKVKQMSSKTYAYLIQMISLTLIVGALFGCEANDEEQAALSVVSDGVQLLESQNVAKTLRLTTKDFLAQPGRLNKSAVTGKLISFFHKSGDIEILHPTLDVDIRNAGKSALVSTPFVVAKKGVEREDLDDLADNSEAWTELASTYTKVENAEISLIKQEGRWLIRTVRF